MLPKKSFVTWVLWMGCIIGGFGSIGCRITEKLKDAPKSDLVAIYQRSAQHHDGMRNPVIVIPGILGSQLTDPTTGRTIWGTFDGTYLDPGDEGSAEAIAIPMRTGVPLAELTDPVVADGVVRSLRVRIAGIPAEQQAYAQILSSLGVGGYVDEDLKDSIDYGSDHFTCFQFSYDWRRGCSENAVRLHEFIAEKAAYVRAERKRRFGVDQPVKFDIVAHSMGALVARYYMRYGAQPLISGAPPPALTWAGCEAVERLVAIGAPNAGSAETLDLLVNGYKLGPFLPTYASALLGSFPATYQLLPRVRHHAVTDDQSQAVDLFDVKVWHQNHWGLLDPRQQDVLRQMLPDVKSADERYAIAYDHLDKCLRRAKAFQQSIDLPADPPPRTTIHLIAGDSEPTVETMQVESETGRISTLAMSPGDGTVTRRSALMDERNSDDPKWTPRLVSPINWSSVNFLFNDHIGITRTEVFTDNLLYLLLQDPRRN